MAKNSDLLAPTVGLVRVNPADPLAGIRDLLASVSTHKGKSLYISAANATAAAAALKANPV